MNKPFQTQAQFIARGACISCGSANLSEISTGKFTDQPLHDFLEADPWGVNPMPYLKDAEWVFVECSGCGQAFHARILDEEWNERRFSEWMSADAIAAFEERIGSGAQQALDKGRQYVSHALRIEKLTRSLRRPDHPVRILDFGCGWGHFLAACQTFGFDAIGVDRSQPRRSGSSIPIHASIEELADGPKFHAITLFEVLEHLDNPSDILRKLRPLLVPGGLLVLETPDCAGVTGIKTHNDYRRIHPLEHINAFTHQTLKSISGLNGFSCIDRGAAHVTADLGRVIRSEAKRALKRDSRSTQLYFRLI